MASGIPEAAICVQDIDVQCVLQFTLLHAAGCALHRHTSRVIHRLEFCHVHLSKILHHSYRRRRHGVRRRQAFRGVDAYYSVYGKSTVVKKTRKKQQRALGATDTGDRHRFFKPSPRRRRTAVCRFSPRPETGRNTGTPRRFSTMYNSLSSTRHDRPFESTANRVSLHV